MTHVIRFNPDGTAQAMHNDAMPLAFLGRQEITRASDIRFDAQTQKWGIWLPRTDCRWARADNDFYSTPTPDAHGFDSYDEARKMEVCWMDACLVAGVEPDSGLGHVIIGNLRRLG